MSFQVEAHGRQIAALRDPEGGSAGGRLPPSPQYLYKNIPTSGSVLCPENQHLQENSQHARLHSDSRSTGLLCMPIIRQECILGKATTDTRTHEENLRKSSLACGSHSLNLDLRSEFTKFVNAEATVVLISEFHKDFTRRPAS